MTPLSLLHFLEVPEVPHFLRNVSFRRIKTKNSKWFPTVYFLGRLICFEKTDTAAAASKQ